MKAVEELPVVSGKYKKMEKGLEEAGRVSDVLTKYQVTNKILHQVTITPENVVLTMEEVFDVVMNSDVIRKSGDVAPLFPTVQA
nr:hypothetical protein [Tanacetum cinerariifolium]